MLVYKLRHAVAAQEYREIVEPGYNTLQFNAFYQKHGDGRLGFSEGVQKEVLKTVIFFSHYLYPIILLLLAKARAKACGKQAMPQFWCNLFTAMTIVSQLRDSLVVVGAVDTIFAN